jgi:succinate dehydrogenase/fumarate reductase flavoprotein subunit
MYSDYTVGDPIADTKAPEGPIERRWEDRRFGVKLVNPANKRKLTIIVVGTGLAGGSAAASLAELGYHVKSFCYQDSPRRAHSIAAQGGINAAKNYRNDGDSVHRLFYDTVKGGDFRARESNVHRLAEVSVEIIDQCVAQGVPFAREYGGLLDNRSFGGTQVSRTFYAKGQTGQQLLLGAYQALERQIDAGGVEMFARHPTCIPVSGDHQSKLTLMSESLRNDGRVWVPKAHGDKRPAGDIPEDERDYFLERRYPAYGNLVPRDIASRAAKSVCDEGRGVGPTGLGVYLDFADAIERLGRDAVAAKYGNLFQMYQRITGEDPYEVPMRIFPAVHYTMGGLWVDYDLQSTIPGLFVVGEANFSDHGANRLGASALMQGLADGYFVLPTTIGDYLARGVPKLAADHPAVTEAETAVRERIEKLLSINGTRTVDDFHRELGHIMWDMCGMERTEAGLRKALERIPELRREFWENVKVPGSADTLNQALEKAGRVADFLEQAELMCLDALHRTESCGGHFRAESQTPDGEALRDDEHFSYVAAWEFTGSGTAPVLHKEDLVFDYVHPSQRSYA